MAKLALGIAAEPMYRFGGLAALGVLNRRISYNVTDKYGFHMSFRGRYGEARTDTSYLRRRIAALSALGTKRQVKADFKTKTYLDE